MSAAFASYVRGLFGCDELADCTVAFYVEPQPSAGSKRPAPGEDDAIAITGSAERQRVGEPIPAHRMALCGGSERLRAQAQRWTQVEEQAASGRPELRVPLASADELPAARAALRFIYTGELSGEGCTTCAELLAVRVQADYLQVDGGVAACDRALEARVSGSASASDASAAAGAGSNSTPSLAGVLELYACRHQLPEHDAANTVATAKLLHACREALVQHCKPAQQPQLQLQPQVAGQGQQQQAQAGAAAAAVGGVGLGELLAFAFHDAPSALSDPRIAKQLTALPAAALEALLACDAFGTDNEASVLLLLAEWRQANRDAFAAAADRLCRQVRLRHLNAAYLYGVLPCLSWFPLSSAECGFLCQYVAAKPDMQELMAQRLKDKFDTAGPWYAAPARPQRRSDAGRPYAWHIGVSEWTEGTHSALGTFTNNAIRLASEGLVWRPVLYKTTSPGPEYCGLVCGLPAALQIELPSNLAILASTSVRFGLFTWHPDGRPKEQVVCTFRAERAHDAFQLSQPGALRLTLPDMLLDPPPAEQRVVEGEGQAAAGTAARAQLLQRWRDYLRKGSLHGTLTWL